MSRYEPHFDLDRLFARAALLMLTNAELARRAGVHPLTISRIQRGQTVPRIQTVQALARAVGLRAKDLVLGATTSTP